jgi:hypothetical protein
MDDLSGSGLSFAAKELVRCRCRWRIDAQKNKPAAGFSLAAGFFIRVFSCCGFVGPLLFAIRLYGAIVQLGERFMIMGMCDR